jgi:hypothetical protein
MPPKRYPWRVFWALFAAAIIGAAAILPYVFEVFAAKLAADAAGTSPLLIVVTQLLHLTLIFGIATSVGLILAPKAGICLPFLHPRLYGQRSELLPNTFRVASVAGLIVGTLTVAALYLVILPRIPEFPTEAAVPLWKRLGVCIYGGINEELLMRLFFLSLVLWAVHKIGRRAPDSSKVLFWISNVLVALVFGAAYLPATASIVPLTAFSITAIVLLKGASGIVFGYLAWTRGLEAAIIAHFVADLLIHIIGPFFSVR